MVTVYALLDPRDGRVRYIGCTSNPTRRLKAHISDGRRGHQTSKARWIASLLELGARPQLTILESVTTADGPNAEARWLRIFHNAGAPLTNARSVDSSDHELRVHRSRKQHGWGGPHDEASMAVGPIKCTG